MTGTILVSIQRALAQGHHFEKWWKEQEFFVRNNLMKKDRMKIEFEQYEEMFKDDLKRFKSTIVTDTKGWPPEHFEFILHSSLQAATAHGKKTLGHGKFLLKEWSTFKQSYPFRFMTRCIATRNRMNQYRKPKTK